MIVSECFDGDDMSMALAQLDLYSGRAFLEEHLLNGRTTIGYLWIECIWGLLDLRPRTRVLQRLSGQLERRGRMDHRIIQPHHDYLAAHFRHAVWRQWPDAGARGNSAWWRLHCLTAWHQYLEREVPGLMRSRGVAEAWARMIVYQNFEQGEAAAGRLSTLLMERYGLECLASTHVARETPRKTG